MVPLGIAACIGAVGLGAYKFKNRGTMSASVYIMQLRVIAQTMVVGAMTLTLGYQMARTYIFKQKD